MVKPDDDVFQLLMQLQHGKLEAWFRDNFSKTLSDMMLLNDDASIHRAQGEARLLQKVLEYISQASIILSKRDDRKAGS